MARPADDRTEPWVEEPQRLSGFLIQAVVFDAILHARFGGNATAVSAEARDAVLARVQPLPGDLWLFGGARFYAQKGALVMTMEYEGACDVWLAARTPLALSPFEPAVSDEWDRVAF